MEIYGIAGMPLSGKSTVAETLRDEGFATLEMGDVVRIERQERELEMDEGSFAEAMRERHGEDAVARLSIPYFEEVMDERDRIAITGMRSLEEKRRFEDAFGEIELIAVWASPETREKRREKRGRQDDDEPLEERDLREIEWGLGGLIARSNHVVKNEGTKEELEEKVKKIVG